MGRKLPIVSVVDDKEADVNEWRACHIPVVEVEDRVIKYQFSSKNSCSFWRHWWYSGEYRCLPKNLF